MSSSTPPTSTSKGSRVKVKKKHVRVVNATTSSTTTTTTTTPIESTTSGSGVLKRVVRRRSRRDDDVNEPSNEDSQSSHSEDSAASSTSSSVSSSTTAAAITTTTTTTSTTTPTPVLSLSAGSVLRKSPFRNETVALVSSNSVGATRSRSGSRSSPRDAAFNRPTNVSAKNLLGVEHAGFLRVFNGPPGQRMRFDEKTKSGFLMLRAANLSIYRSRDDDAPSEVIPLRSSAVKVISGGDAMFALPAGAADSPRSSSAVDSESPSTTTTPPPSTSATPMPAANNNNNNNNSGLQRRDSPPRENAPSILSSLKNRRLRRGSIGSLPQSHVMSSLGHSPGRVISASASATPDESDDEPDGASTPTSSLPTVGGGSCVFALFTPAVSKTFLARDQEDMNEWVAKLNQAATRLLNEALEEVGVATAAAVEPDVTRSVRAAGGAVVSERELAKRVAALRALPGNDRCCDCGAADTAWVLANKGGLICIDCSGVHRQMGVTVSKVRSFELDQWSEPALAFLERTGNEALNERLEHRRANADRDRATLTRSDFLRKKYVDQAYVSTSKRATQLEEFVETFA